MLGTVRNVDGTNQPFTIAGLSDGSTDIVHRECNEEYQIPMAVDCQYGAGYLGITDCCKFLFNPTTGVAKVHCVETTATNVDINNNSDIGSNQPILAQGFDEDGLYDNSVEKTAVVYNANCYLCNDPTTGSPVCKPVLKATTFCADEYLGLPKDYPVKYVNTLPVSPDIEDYIYSFDETKSLTGKPLKFIRDTYYGAANTKCIVLDGKEVASINATYTAWTDTDGNSYVSTQDSSYSNSCVVETAFKAGDATNQLLYDIGSGGSGDGSLELANLPTSGTSNLAFVDQFGKIAYCDTGIEACKDAAGNLILKRECITKTISPTGFTESSSDASNNCRHTIDEACCFRRAISCNGKCSIIYQDKNGTSITSCPATSTGVESWISSNVDYPICAVQVCNCTGSKISTFRTGLFYDGSTCCTFDFEALSCCAGLCNDLKFNTSIRYGRFGLSYTGCNNANCSYNSLSIGGGVHSYTEVSRSTTNIGGDCYYTLNTYKDEINGYNNHIKTITSKSIGNSSHPENTYKQLELKTHLNDNTHYSSERYECIEMTYKCVCSGNTCFEGKTKYCTTDGKWYVCCDSTKGYKCLLNEDEASSVSVTVNANNDSCWYNLTGTTNNTDLIYSCVNRVAADPATGRVLAAGGFTSDGSAVVKAESTNELNVYPASGTAAWINYRGGATEVCIGNGNASGLGNLYASNLNGTLNGCMSYGDPAVSGFRANQTTSDAYCLAPGDWGNYLNFSHGDFMSYYGASVRVPFWDAHRFTWRVNNNGSLCPIHELLDNRGDQTICGRNYYFTGEHAANTRSAAIVSSSYTSVCGYNGGAWIGHNNQNYDGYWGFAEFGFYNAETDVLCPGLCVGRNGEVHACSFSSSYYQGPYGKLDFITNNRVELSSSASSGGTVVYGPNCVGYVYLNGSGLYLNAGTGSINMHHPAVFEKSVTFVEPGVKTAMCISTSNSGDDIDFYACCNLGFVSYNCGDICLVSDYDLCATARCRLCFEAPTVLVCNTTGDLCWESANSCGKYQKEPNVYSGNDLFNINWDIASLATVSNRIILDEARLGSSNITLIPVNCGSMSLYGSNTYWTGEVIPIGNNTAIFNGSIRLANSNVALYGGMKLNTNNYAFYGFQVG